MTYSIIEITNIKKKIIYTKNISLLFILKLHDIHVEYQCQSGYCGICRIELIKGEVLYSIKQPMAALFEEREILPCCCKPNGNIIIKI
ncbi:2Fe-2S cluster-containing protein involved in diferric-tyrosyl radical cofactor maintenance [Buchnera aphidicola str. Ak (Acyrthosiphon kondoi)]|uniref:2Fe-2S cluster-containing protein involved in diferric-tyrosyl radical cofactor maintenance n=1 Tax=Buchnera aphidicola str. Ak (Acyrthosiphon kondoi) TaxID=1005090 RepID=G2LMP7_9GAMM|nr:class I ribonucleotide reductase maintenance protein YfaE [Buchnera aphidicola]AEO08535.1 2Fe-2S cluster-containing protein involved in diferric-tyrosyl radical cofactor maintenance [Buchnera aphidicola str. Ak (Acyrthosiphon kondoi)]WAI18112.1 MAG: class I ribonucleotide reductase maintenance protein YfaE [Buchnera aphidicola (Acyrthosiphon caraganae)]